MFKMAFRSIILRRKQFSSLFFVCVFGIGISLSCLYLSKGMLSSLEEKARLYYGGEIALMCGKYGGINFDNVQESIENIKEDFPKDCVVSNRFAFDASYSSIYFEGTEARLRVINGLDFDNEKKLLSTMNLDKGSILSSNDMKEKKCIILSKPIAKKLDVNIGEKITFLTRLPNGFITTSEFEVAAIFKDSSVFGMYTAYIDIDVLKNACGMNENWANRICVQFPNNQINQKMLSELHKKLSLKLNMFRMIDDKKIFYDELGSLTEDTYAIIPLSANLNDIKIMEIAMHSVISFIIIMLVIIIIAGIGSAYKVIVMKRINEIGVYMALGMKKSRITWTLAQETLLILLSGALSGFLFSMLICGVLRLIDFSFIPSFDIFLSNGILKSAMNIQGTFIVFLSTILVTLLVVIHSVRKSVSIMPVQALTTTE